MQYKIVKDYKFKRLQRNNSMPEMFKDPIILKKEKEWDSRFIYNKIPEYDSFTDKNVLNKGIFNSNIKNTSLANVNKKKIMRTIIFHQKEVIHIEIFLKNQI